MSAFRFLAPTGCGMAFALAISSGCGDRGFERVVVSGTVTHNGKPLPDGAIRFTPVSTSDVPTNGAMIVDGKYRIDSQGGVPVGTHRVRIEAFSKLPDSAQPSTHSPAVTAGNVAVRRRLSKARNGNADMEVTIPAGSKEVAKDFDMID
jgi:hypothetical protein